MANRSVGLAATLAVAVIAAACDQAPPSAPPDGPSFASTPTEPVCTFTGNPSVGNAANSYFTLQADRKTASDIIVRMQAGFSSGSYLGARDAGYDLLSLTGKASRAGTGSDTANGAALVRQAVQCMFDVAANDESGQPFSGWPAAAQFDFGRALVATAGGAFFVRGAEAGTVDPVSAPVVANDVSRIPFGGQAKDGNISGVAPDATHNWRIATTNPTKPGILSERVLIYGQPVTDGYDWKLIPRSTTFNPYVTVALCPAATTGGSTTADMITQFGIGVLGYVSGDAICGTNPATLAYGAPSALNRMATSAFRLLAPAPLQAAALATTPSGGTARTAKGDVFKIRTVQDVELTLTLLVPNTNTVKPWPANLKVNTEILGDILVDVQTKDSPKSPVGGVEVTLRAVNNNGFTQVGQKIGNKCEPVLPKTTESVVSTNGQTSVTQVLWEDACITKTGIVNVAATSTANGRTGGVGIVEGPKFNVKPK